MIESKQKYQRTDICKVIFGHHSWAWDDITKTISDYPIDIAKHEVGRLVSIMGSYNDLYDHYGCHDSDYPKYEVIFLDNGSITAWKGEDQLEFVSHGTEKDIIDARYIYRNKSNMQNNDV